MPLRKKKLFFYVRKKVPMATKPRGGGSLKALVAGPLRKELFFAASLRGAMKKIIDLNKTFISVSVTDLLHQLLPTIFTYKKHTFYKVIHPT